MDQSPRLSLSYLLPAQAQKHVTVNETFRRLDQLVQQAVLSRTVAAEPGAPNDGDAYILPASPTGTAWATYAQNNIAAYQDGAWAQIPAAEGFRAWVADTDEFIIYDGAAWNPISGGGSETAALFGVNTTADATNKFAVKSNAILFDSLDVAESGTGDSQVKINKEAVGDTASFLFQTGLSSRAEIGLTGNDDFHVKVSANGSSWTDALIIDKSSGDLTVGHDSAATTKVLKKFTTSHAPANVPSEIHLGMFDGALCGIKILNTLNGSFNQQEIEFHSHLGGVSSGKRLGIDPDGSIVVGAPTGSGKGAGTINAIAVYDDNTLLTCYVFDQVLDGAIDTKKWDDKVIDRIIPEKRDSISGERIPQQIESRLHEPMRKFRTRIGTANDPLTLDGYAKHWREKRHLTSMPNEATFDPASGLSSGEWVQRLVETVEIQAILIEELNQRVKTLEPAKTVR